MFNGKPESGDLWPRSEPMCRDCADFGPICPNSGNPCGLPGASKGSRAILADVQAQRAALRYTETHDEGSEPC